MYIQLYLNAMHSTQTLPATTLTTCTSRDPEDGLPDGDMEISDVVEGLLPSS